MSVDAKRLSQVATLSNIDLDLDLSGSSKSPARTPKRDSLLRRLLLQLFGLRAKLIVPYVLLTLLTAMVGTFVVTRLVASSIRERFVNQLYESSRVASDAIVRKERNQLSNLRLMAFAVGVAEAVQTENATSLQDLLWPLALNNNVEAVTAIDLQGEEIITLAQDPSSGRYLIYQGGDYSESTVVGAILGGDVDSIGDKYAGFLLTSFGPYLFTSGPVRDPSNEFTGVLMVGSRLESLLIELKSQALADVIILDLDGRLIATTFPESTSAMELEAGTASSADLSLRQSLQVSDRSYQVIYVPLVVRQQHMGVLGIALPSNYIVDAESTSRWTFGGIFTGATLAVVVIGYVLSQSIIRPLLRLRMVSRAVAEGDLNQKTGLARSDEIGELASVFDLMTYRLRRRTEQAAALYAETVQRNKELADINVRLQAAQQQLIQSEKLAAVGQLTAGIVHDVKNPLAVIKGLAEELREDEGLDAGARMQLSTIRDNATRASTIVSDLLKFARQSTPEMRRQDLCETLRTAMRLTDFLARKARVDVDVILPHQAVTAAYDAQQIEQVLVNLMQNAVQAMPDGGELRLELALAPNQVAIIVEDTGVGIPQENLRRIFDPFFTTKPEGEGTGLGLSVSYGIIARHKGRIEVESKLGKGTKFTVWLPLEPSGADY